MYYAMQVSVRPHCRYPNILEHIALYAIILGTEAIIPASYNIYTSLGRFNPKDVEKLRPKQLNWAKWQDGISREPPDPETPCNPQDHPTGGVYRKLLRIGGPLLQLWAQANDECTRTISTWDLSQSFRPWPIMLMNFNTNTHTHIYQHLFCWPAILTHLEMGLQAPSPSSQLPPGVVTCGGPTVSQGISKGWSVPTQPRRRWHSSKSNLGQMSSCQYCDQSCSAGQDSAVGSVGSSCCGARVRREGQKHRKYSLLLDNIISLYTCLVATSLFVNMQFGIVCTTHFWYDWVCLISLGLPHGW